MVAPKKVKVTHTVKATQPKTKELFQMEINEWAKGLNPTHPDFTFLVIDLKTVQCTICKKLRTMNKIGLFHNSLV